MTSKNVRDSADLVKILNAHFEEEICCQKLLECLFTAQSYLRENPFGKRNRENYIRSLETSLVKTPEYRKFLLFCSLIEVSKLKNMIFDMVSKIDEEIPELEELLDDLLEKLEGEG